MRFKAQKNIKHVTLRSFTSSCTHASEQNVFETLFQNSKKYKKHFNSSLKQLKKKKCTKKENQKPSKWFRKKISIFWVFLEQNDDVFTILQQ